MATKPCPTNFLAARENYQCTKYRLLRTEEKLHETFGTKTLADLENAMLKARSQPFNPHRELIALYAKQQIEHDEADRIFEAASIIQRQRIKLAEKAQKEIGTDIAKLDE